MGWPGRALALGLGLALSGVLADSAAAQPAVGATAGIVAVSNGVPMTLAAVSLLGGAVILVVLELHLPTHGLLGIAGLAAFLLGSFLLFAPPDATAPVVAAIEASLSLLLILGAISIGFIVVAMRASLHARRMPVIDPLTRVSGALGVATSPLAPNGTVRVLRQTWSAVTSGPPIPTGQPVEVIGRDGLTLRVRATSSAIARDAGVLPSQGEVRPGVRVEGIR